MTRDFILFYLNGRRFRMTGPVVFRRLSEFLRDEQRLVGTKVACAEGACGACAVLKGTLEGGLLRYRAVNSCLQHLYQLDGSHVVTVEGLADGEACSAVQEALVGAHGAQCGFCTPGFVIALTAAQEDEIAATELPEALSGNLCRCTGYLPILEAGRAIECGSYQSLAYRYPSEEMTADLAVHTANPIEIRHGHRTLFAPVTPAGAVQAQAEHPGAILVAGATELGVPPSAPFDDAQTLLSLGNIHALSSVRREGETLVLGAGATWTQVEQSVRTECPELAAYLRRFAGPQIRNVGTVAGSIVHASPIADSLPPLLVLDARLEIQSSSGTRQLLVRAFTEGDRPPGLVTRVVVPLPRAGQTLRLFKVSSRRGFDRSLVSAAFLLEQDEGAIRTIRIALGGVGPHVMRLPRTEAFLQGATLKKPRLQAAAEVLRAEIAPVTDGRATAAYRRQLAENLLLKFYHSLEGNA